MRALCWHFGMMARSCRRRCALAVDGATLPQRRNPGLGSVFGRGGGRRRIGGRVRRLVMARLYMLRRGVRFLREKPAVSSSRSCMMHRRARCAGWGQSAGRIGPTRRIGGNLPGASGRSVGWSRLVVRVGPICWDGRFARRAGPVRPGRGRYAARLPYRGASSFVLRSA